MGRFHAGALVFLGQMFQSSLSMNSRITDLGERSVSEEFSRQHAAGRDGAIFAGIVVRARRRRSRE
jgi:hypothetical protein